MINRYENSDTEPRIGFAVEVANALNISLDELRSAFYESEIKFYTENKGR